jgi:hypothetical protein
VLEIDLDRFMLAMDYIAGERDREVSVGELALIYSMLPELLLELNSADDIVLIMKKE